MVAGIKVTPKLLALGGIVLAAIVGIFVYMNMSSKPGSITVSPSTFSCSSSTLVTSTIKLPSSLKATDQITVKQDGQTTGTVAVSAFLTQQPDGSWLLTSPQTASDMCTSSSGPLSMGVHTMQVLDANGKVLAEGSMTLQP